VVEAWDLAVREPVEEAANRKSSEYKKRLAFCQPFFTSTHVLLITIG
jgi:hypothetical protein